MVVGMTLGAPIALSAVDAPLAVAALTFVVDDAAAQATPSCGGGVVPTITLPGTPCTTSDNDVEIRGGTGRGVGQGGDGGDGGNGGLAMLHEAITMSATSDTSQSLSNSPTGDINNVVTYNIEDTDETVVILNAGNPGSTGTHMLNVGAASQIVNSGGNTGSADASGGEGGNGTGGHGTGTGGNGGDNVPRLPTPAPITIPTFSP